MRIRYMSDLHLEFIRPAKMQGFLRRISPPTDPHEICVLAGDIGNPYGENYNTLMDFMSRSFKKTFVIAGNHEYYQPLSYWPFKYLGSAEPNLGMKFPLLRGSAAQQGGIQNVTVSAEEGALMVPENSNRKSEGFSVTYFQDQQGQKEKTMEETADFLRETIATRQNITFLNNSCEVYEDTCFIGTTLWSKITRPQYEINDVYNIPNFDYIKYNRLNRASVDFLESAVEDAQQKCVIITHHVPSNDLIDPKYKTERMRPYNQWFYCDMDDFIKTHRNKICAWIYGHTHTSCSTTLYGVPMLCNPIGYPGENSWRAEISASLELPSSNVILHRTDRYRM